MSAPIDQAKSAVKAVLRRHPWIGIGVMKCVRPMIFQRERKGWRGADTDPGNGRPSLVFFSHYRCASMMLMRRLKDLTSGLGYRVLNYQTFIHTWPIGERENFMHNVEENRRFRRFNPLGRFYTPLRFYVDIPDVEKFRVHLLLRDPRDVLVSRYFSEKFAHIRIDERFNQHCLEVEQMDIDQFALHFLEDVAGHYDLYQRNWNKMRQLRFVRYEDMIADFPGYLQGMNAFYDCGKSESEVAAIAAKENFEVTKEDKFAHKRSVKARSFESKLKPETIDALNERFAGLLDFFGWEK